MARLPVLVLRTAGINCDAETMLALELSGAAPQLVHLNRLIERPELLEQARLLVFPGGFSYGDYVAAGRVFAVELKARLSAPLQRYVAQGGFVLGICNGFQVLTETGLFDDSFEERSRRRLTLTNNRSNRFEARWTLVEGQACAASWIKPGERIPMPVAHGEGQLAVRDAQTLVQLRELGQIALRYIAADGSPAQYPDCPNGSIDNIAGLCDPTGRVFGLMPHPERNITPWNHPTWTRLGPRTEGEGLGFFRRLVHAAGYPVPVS